MCVFLFCLAFWWQAMNMDLVFSEFASRQTSVLQPIEVLYISLYSPPATIINFISLYSVLGYNSSTYIFLLAYSLCVRSTVEDRSIVYLSLGLADIYQLPPPCHLHTQKEGIKSRQ